MRGQAAFRGRVRVLGAEVCRCRMRSLRFGSEEAGGTLTSVAELAECRFVK